MNTRSIRLYDTTLRDGAQDARINLTLSDMQRITQALVDFGIDFIEGGYPGASPLYDDYFRACRDTDFEDSVLVAFGAVRRADVYVEEDRMLQALVLSPAPVVTVFGKTWTRHVTDVLHTSLEENLSMIRDSIVYLRACGKRVIFDAEHFFDGMREDSVYTNAVLEVACSAGAENITLCDTRGGVASEEMHRAIKMIKSPFVSLGVHFHNDRGLALANTLEALEFANCDLLQGTMNGYGERCGNANLIAVMGNMYHTGPDCDFQAKKYIPSLRALAKQMADVANLPLDPSSSFVGRNAFCHKAGVHVQAIERGGAEMYEFADPTLFGNRRHYVLSDLSGRDNVQAKAVELGVDDLSDEQVREVLALMKQREADGFRYNQADASLLLLMLKIKGGFKRPFDVLRYSVDGGFEDGEAKPALAAVKIAANEHIRVHADEGEGPVNALDRAMRGALAHFFPDLGDVQLLDFKVRVIDGLSGTDARILVQCEFSDGQENWRTVGASKDIIEASFQALSDSYAAKLYWLGH